MAVKVVDASALGALLFGEPDGALIAERLRGAGLVAPALLPFEIANICLKKVRRHPDQRDALMAAFEMLGRMELGVMDVDHGDVLGLAERSGGLPPMTRATCGSPAGRARSWSRLTGSSRRRRQRDRKGLEVGSGGPALMR